MESFQSLLVNSQIVLYIVQVLVAVALIGFILIQQGKGADAGASFGGGGGASGTVFGSQGGGNFFTKVTAFLAIIFLVNSLLLAYIATQRMNETDTSSLMVGVEEAIQETEAAASTDIPEAVEAAEESSDIPAIPE